VQLVDMVARAFVNFTLKKNNLTVLNYTSDGILLLSCRGMLVELTPI